jgi:hypothetical protein
MCYIKTGFNNISEECLAISGNGNCSRASWNVRSLGELKLE